MLSDALALQAERSRRYAELAREKRLLPEKISPFYRRKLDAEAAALGGFHGPLARGALAGEERLSLVAPHEIADWVDDRANTPEGGQDALIRKYADRLLFAPTSVCAGHCLYCFRQDMLSERHGREDYAFKARLAQMEAMLDADPALREVVISGGDPLTLPAKALAMILEAITRRPGLRAPRIHSRAAAFAPQSFTAAKIDAMAAAKARLVLHFIHPYEICDEVAALLERLRAAGVRLYNQFPLLRGVNDHPLALSRLMERLDELSVRPLSIFVPEPIHGSAAYRLPMARIEAIWREFRQTNPSWITGLRLSLDSPKGKIWLEDIVSREEGWITFQRLNGEVRYPDFPAALDVPGEIRTLLWRG